MDIPKVVATRRLPERARALLAGAVTYVENAEDAPMDPARLAEEARDASGLVTVLADRIDAPFLAAAPALRVVANVAAGHDNIDSAAARARGVVVTNTPDALTETTADLTWALLLAVARRVVEGDRDVRAGRFRGWELLGWLGHDVHGKTLGIVGFGRIGQAVARRAVGFGMRVLYHDPQRVAPEVERALHAEPAPLDRLFAEAHVVTLHTPLTPASRHLVDAATLARMRPDAVLVNVARGPVVDETALVEALRAGRLAGAGFDVYEHEPALTPGLAALANVVLLPHVGSATVETRETMAVLAAESVLDVLAGRAPRFQVVSGAR